jgi:hypothetical protein
MLVLYKIKEFFAFLAKRYSRNYDEYSEDEAAAAAIIFDDDISQDEAIKG